MAYNPFFSLENPELLRYEYTWVNYVKYHKEAAEEIRKEISESWKRCKDNKIDYLMRNKPVLLDESEIRNKINKNKTMLNIALPFMETLLELVKDCEFHVEIIDDEGYLLKSVTKKEFSLENKTKKFAIGESKREDVIGTSSVGMVLLHKEPWAIIGAEHYCQELQKGACYAAPIFDKKGKLKAILNMSGTIDQICKHTLGMVTAAAKAIQNELALKEIHDQIVQSSEEQREILETVTDGVIYVNNDGIITQTNSEMAKFLGEVKEKIIGRDIGILNTTPSIINIIDTLSDVNTYEIIINGKYKSYSCFLNVKYFSGGTTDKKNKVFVFTRMEEIQALASQINIANQAYFTFKDIIGKSKLIRDVIDLGKKAASYSFRVVIEGESGTGKEMFAQAIHNNSARAKNPFIAVDCGAIPRQLLESELFGYEEGAFTGAKKSGQRGKFELAHKGTIFLDEIGNMPIEMQAKLLRVLQEKRITRIGGYTPIPIDVQVIAATNLNLEEEVQKGNFREDLFYRLNVINIKLPPLRKRKEDIPILVEHFIKSLNIGNKTINKDALNILMNYNWPGNVRQLHNLIEKLLIITKSNKINKDMIPKEILEYRDIEEMISNNEIEPLNVVTEKYIMKVLKFYEGNIKKTSEILGISRTTIYKILERNKSN